MVITCRFQIEGANIDSEWKANDLLWQAITVHHFVMSEESIKIMKMMTLLHHSEICIRHNDP